MKRGTIIAIVGVAAGAGLVAFAAWKVQSSLESLGEDIKGGLSDELAKEIAKQNEAGDGLDAEALVEQADQDGGPAGDLPVYVQKKIQHLNAINKMMLMNISDCTKMAAEIEAYNRDHKAELEALGKAERAAQSKMTFEERQAIQEKELKIMKPMMFKMIKLITMVALKCPNELKAVQKASEDFKQ